MQKQMWKFDLQLFAIDNLPAVQSVVEQVNLLERLFHTPLDAQLAYSRLADQEIFPSGIGETFTKSRPALYPLSSGMTPLNPSTNTGLDNGLTDQYYSFEQYQMAISQYAVSTTVNTQQDFTLIQRILMQNYYALGEGAGRVLDSLAAQYTHQAYDGGNTFATEAISGTTSLTVDNILGFDKAFSATNSPGLPTTTSSGNPVTANVYNGSTGALKGTITITATTASSPNTSTAFVNNVAWGVSGTLTILPAAVAISTGDQILASDGSYIVRPGTNVLTRYQLASTNILTLQTLANATAKLRARNVPPLPSGNYLAIIDPTLWPQLLSDTAFNYATMGQMGEGYFKNALVNRTLGLEFMNSNMVPVYNLPSGGTASGVGFARHCLVGGMGMLIKGTFDGFIRSAQMANGMDNSDIRFFGAEKIALITRAPLDRLQQQVTQTWNWVGAFVAPTDVTSTPLIIPTTDYARYKRAVDIEVYSAI